MKKFMSNSWCPDRGGGKAGKKGSMASLVCSLLFLQLDPFLQPRQCNIPRLQKCRSAEEVEVAVGWVVMCLPSRGCGRAGGGELSWFWGGLGRAVPRQRTGRPWSEPLKVSPGDFLEPTKLSRLTYKATRQGWRSCLVSLGVK